MSRGTSTVESSAIGGDAAVGWSLVSDDNTLGGLLPGGGQQQGVQSITTPTEVASYVVDQLAGSTATPQSGSVTFAIRPADGSTVTSLNELTDTSVDVTFTFQYSDVNGGLLSSETQMFTFTRSELTFITLEGGVAFRRFESNEFADITIPTGAETVDMLINFQTEAGSDWGFTFIDVSNLFFVALIPKPSTSAAYISSPNINNFALDVLGGRGARINSIELFRGSETSVSTFGAEGDEEETLYVQVSWLDTNDGGSSGSSNLQTTIPFIKSSRAALDAIYPGQQDFVPLTISQPIYNRFNDYVGVLTATSLFTSLTIRTQGAASNISGQRIRRIWSKLK